MYELNTQQIQSVAGGYLVYVTEEWKQSEANITGAVFGSYGAILGCFAGSAGSLAGTALGVLAGGTVGYYIGYGLSRLENRLLENNTWYDSIYIYNSDDYYVIYY